MSVPDGERFAKRYLVDDNGCWIWTAGLGRNGYGSYTDTGGRRNVKAHRKSWELHRGPIPAGMMVCHRCDVRTCVNPDHLFIGTGIENMRDMVSKSRQARGEASARSKLTAESVMSIRNAARAGATWKSLGIAYGVSDNSARDAALGITWKHLGAALDPATLCRARRGR